MKRTTPSSLALQSRIFLRAVPPASNFDPDETTVPHTWIEGNFDSDYDVDITDYNYLASHFAPEGYGVSVIPEPSALFLVAFVLVLLGAAHEYRHY